jgi:hypothetical protein
VQGQWDPDQPEVILGGDQMTEVKKKPVDRIEGALKRVGVKWNPPRAEMGITPGNYPISQTPGEECLLGVEYKRDIIKKKLPPST